MVFNGIYSGNKMESFEWLSTFGADTTYVVVKLVINKWNLKLKNSNDAVKLISIHKKRFK